jgi:hypothetical protein
MKPLSSLFVIVMLSFSTAIAANLPDPTDPESQNEISIDETIKTFINHLCENLTLNDYMQHESAVEALMRCSQRFESNSNSLLLHDLTEAYPLLLAGYRELIDEPCDDASALKAPREEMQPFIVGPGVCDISSIRNLLNTILINLNQCCQQIENNFITTLSTIAHLSCSFSGTVIADLNPIFTALNACCNNITLEFQETWTILANLSVTATTDLTGVFTALNACCNNITLEFQETWTILANLTVTATADLTGVFTALNSCCNNITSEFQQTWTIIENLSCAFSGTIIGDLTPVFTALEGITACFATSVTGPTTITQSGYYCLANNVSGSFVIAANDVVLDLNSHTITTGGVIVQTGIVGATIRNGSITDSTVGVMLNDTINATVENVSITESPGLTALVTSGSGNRLTDIYIDTVAIGISGDGVNFNEYLLIDGLTLANTTGTGIVFNGNGLLSSVIKNATIANCGSNGIVCEGQCAYNTFSDIEIDLCNQIGLYFFAGAGQHFGCNLVNVSVNSLQGTASIAGILATNAINFRFVSCAVRGCFGPTFSFFSLLQGSGNVLESCLAVTEPDIGQANFGFQIGSSQTVVKNCQAMSLQQNAGSLSAFYSNAPNNQFNNCTAMGIVSTTIGSPTVIAGFKLDTGATNNLIIDCQALNIQSDLGNGIGFYSDSAGSQIINCSAEQIFTNFANADTGNVYGFFIDTTASNNSCINCKALDIQNEVNFTDNLSYGYFINGVDTTLYNCIADDFGNVNQIDEAFGFMIADGATHATLVNCAAVNSNGAGFFIEQTGTTLINCKASGNLLVGFSDSIGNSFAFRDCTSMFNPGTGFASGAGPAAIAAMNCFGVHNGTNFALWPNVQANGVASPVVGVNISA